ncbi:MAG: adenosylcobinamide-GDP ribazoletransferase [Oscillospiraceae bacterium]|nr:adenosylcobinamide-GDP ribazoletransferase [Oscillospiraceae bacterium]
MKQYLHGFAMCQSMFCAIPFPWQIWDEKARDKMLLFLPVVGIEMGVLWAVLAWLCNILEIPALIRGLILSVYPFLVTGFIHLDGYMDVTDAVGSCRSLERRREILKDSHVGAFAVIGLGLLLVGQFAFMAGAKEGADYRILVFVPGVSRCCSALAVLCLKPMSTSQYADNRKNRGHIGLVLVLLGGLLLGGYGLCGKYSLALVGCLVGYGWALRKAYRMLEGMNGDISGYALTLGELSAIAVMALI